MVFKSKKKKAEPKEETINEDEIIDMPGEEPVGEVEEGVDELPEIEPAEPKKKTAVELQLEILELKKQKAIEEKEIEEMDKAEKAEEETGVVEEAIQQVQIPQQPRVVIMDDRDLIRRTFSDVQSLRVEIQNLRYIIDQEIAKE